MRKHPTKRPVDIRSLARSHTETAIRVLAGIMRQATAPAASRVAAASVLLDRGWGKAVSFTTSDAAEFKHALAMSDEELVRIANGGDYQDPEATEALSDQSGPLGPVH